ncbi:MAG: chemotaxis protein CheD [Dehalococcoidia bacterium]
MTTKDQSTTVVVGLGELKLTEDPSEILTCLGLGSCIGICAYDPVAKVAGMVHVVLPSSAGREGTPSPRYADVAVPALLEAMQQKGALVSRMIIKIAGGAQMSLAGGHGSAFQIGEQNTAVIKEILAEKRIKIQGADTGGNHGRTMRFYLDSGKTFITTAGKETQEI